LPWQSSMGALDRALLAAKAEPTGASATATAIRLTSRSRYMSLVLPLLDQLVNSRDGKWQMVNPA